MRGGILLAVLLLCVVVLSGCKGGGGGGPGEVGAEGGGNPPAGGASVNPRLSGRIYVRGGVSRGSMHVLDLATGQYTTLSVTGSIVSASGAFMVIPSRDGKEAVETVLGCSKRDPLTRNDCVYVHQEDGRVVKVLELVYRITSAAKLSHDREHFVFVYDDWVDEKDVTLYLYDRFGRFLNGTRLDRLHGPGGLGGVDWLPDGRLVYVWGWNLYITAPYETRGTLLADFSDKKEVGWPAYLEVSPDGRQVAFTGILSRRMYLGKRGSVWVMDIDDPDSLRELAYVPGATREETTIEYPTWSPDGKWIFVREGYYARETGAFYLRVSTAYAVPSDGVRVPLTRTGETPAVEVFSDSAALITDGARRRLESEFDWVPLDWVP